MHKTILIIGCSWKWMQLSWSWHKNFTCLLDTLCAILKIMLNKWYSLYIIHKHEWVGKISKYVIDYVDDKQLCTLLFCVRMMLIG
jgi:hypothetical protein